MDLKKKIEVLVQHPHCQNCGQIDPECYPGFAYTICCNEAVCDRLEKYIFYNDRISVQACCWAMAEAKFNLKGINVIEQSGMTRLPLNDIDQG